jgi:hypothetical protein
LNHESSSLLIRRLKNRLALPTANQITELLGEFCNTYTHAELTTERERQRAHEQQNPWPEAPTTVGSDLGAGMTGPGAANTLHGRMMSGGRRRKTEPDKNPALESVDRRAARLNTAGAKIVRSCMNKESQNKDGSTRSSGEEPRMHGGFWRRQQCARWLLAAAKNRQASENE